MTELAVLEAFLADAHVDAAVFALRPDYRVMLLAVDGLVTDTSDQVSEALLRGGGRRSAPGAFRAAGGTAPARGGVA